MPKGGVAEGRVAEGQVAPGRRAGSKRQIRATTDGVVPSGVSSRPRLSLMSSLDGVAALEVADKTTLTLAGGDPLPSLGGRLCHRSQSVRCRGLVRRVGSPCGCLAVDPPRSSLKVTGKVRSGPRPSRSRPEVRSRVKPGKERDEEGEMCDVVSCCISWDLISVLNIGQKVNTSRSC